MASVYYFERVTKTKGKRYHVRWEKGGDYPVVHLGVWPTETLAKKRVKSALEQLARGELPTKIPEGPVEPSSGTTIRQLAEKWVATRIDVADATLDHYGFSIAAINEQFGDRDPVTITVDEIQAWILEQSAATRKVGTIRQRLSALSMMLRYAQVKPNPAKDPDLRLPKKAAASYRLPTHADLEKLYTELAEKHVGVVKLMEHSGLRVSEAIAVRHEHWDRKRKRLLVPKSKTSAGTRFIEQLDGLPELPPPGGAGRVWPDVTSASTISAMKRACKLAGIRPYSPHDLRHLHASRLVHDMDRGLSPAVIAARLGHASPQMTLGTYTHVVPPEDPDDDTHDDAPGER